VTYAVTRQFNLVLSVPIIEASWSIPLPVQPTPGPRSEQNARGLGDISLTGRWWVRKTEDHSGGNLSLGLGVKAPTGKYDAADEYPTLSGQNPTVKAVDQSIQPGDGGWGAIFDIQGFKRLGKTVLVGSGTYLANPRGNNGTPSIIVGLGLQGNPSVQDKLVNSVPDQYLVRIGAAYPIGGSGLYVSGFFRAEGLPRYDLFGGSHGFRRPGYETSFEPGLTYARGPDSWSLSMPFALVRDRYPDPYTGLPGDATFPDAIVLFGYAHRFGAAHLPGGPACEFRPMPERLGADGASGRRMLESSP